MNAPSNAESLTQQPLSSKWLLAMLDHRRRIDYLLCALLGGLPSFIAWYLGVHRSITHNGEVYLGFLDKPNMWTQVLLLPLFLFVVRWVFHRIADISSPTLQGDGPPIVSLFKAGEERTRAYLAFRAWMSSPKLARLIIVVVTLLLVLDGRSDVVMFVTGIPSSTAQLDWSLMHLIGRADFLGVVLLWISTECIQLMLFLLRFIAIFGVCAHNLFLLKHIWQRRRASADPNQPLIRIDLEDSERCMGFRKASTAFNLPILLAVVGGFGILLSRFSNVIGQGELQWSDLAHWPIDTGTLFFFPDTGQWILAVAWFVSVVVICMPIAIRFLPSFGPRGPDITAKDYLREYLDDSQGAPTVDASVAQIDVLASKFAEQSFWPAGDNRARFLFIFAWMVMLLVLYPVRPGDPTILVAALFLMVLFAWVLQRSMFGIAKLLLGYVDPRLVAVNQRLESESAVQTINRSVFLSYRHSDSRGYAPLVRDRLLSVMSKDSVFMDLSSLHDGEDFVLALNRAIRESDVVLVLIGPDWLDVRNADGQRRIDDPNDFVLREVKLALQQSPLVIPVLVGGAKMPSEAQLPASIKLLARRHARVLDDGHWEYDCERLIEAISANS